MTKIGITYGAFDVLHYGHIRFLQLCKKHCDYLFIGLASDELLKVYQKNNILFNYSQREEVLKNIRLVDQVFKHNGIIDFPDKRLMVQSQKIEDVKFYKASIVFKGDDWLNEYDFLKPYCNVMYFPRTKNVSSSDIKQGAL